MKYIKKPVTVEAVQFNGENFDEIAQAFNIAPFKKDFGDQLLIDTLEGQMKAKPGDWIIKGIKGEFYPCKPDIFAESYEEQSDLVEFFNQPTEDPNTKLDNALKKVDKMPDEMFGNVSVKEEELPEVLIHPKTLEKHLAASEADKWNGDRELPPVKKEDFGKTMKERTKEILKESEDE